MSKLQPQRRVTQHHLGLHKLEPIGESLDSSVASAARDEKRISADLKQLEMVFPGTEFFNPIERGMTNFDPNESSIQLQSYTAFKGGTTINKKRKESGAENSNFKCFSKGLEELCNESILRIIDECNVDYNRRVTIMSQFTGGQSKKPSALGQLSSLRQF